MAFKCKGDWNSWVDQTFPPSGDPDDPNDGKMEIGAEQVTGKFDGKHKKKKSDPQDPGDVEFDIDGLCKEVSSTHSIEFDTTEGFTYEGTITERVFHGRRRDVAEGTRKRTHRDRKEDADGDDWVAVKVGL